MIKVVLDFKDIKTESDLIFYIGEKLNLATKGRDSSNYLPNFDAFADNFEDIVWKEVDLDNLNKEDQDDIEILKSMNELGLKNEFGVRDDLEIRLINFNEFKKEHPKIASDFLEVINLRLSELYCDKEIEDEIVKVNIVIES